MSDTTDDTTAPKKKGKKKLMVIMLGLLVLGGGAGAGAYAAGLIGGGHAAKVVDNGPKLVPKAEQKRGGSTDGEGHGESKGGGAKPPSGVGGDKYASNYYAMDKDFTANLRDSVHFIQVGVAVSTPYDDSVIDNLKTNDIAVRSAVLMALGDTTEDEVFSSEGKQKLQARITKAINETLKQKEGFGGIGNTYFTSFVVQ